ncbi:type I-U CRISPR-associated RAMP protein Csb1/Cas7u [Actinomyces massiliensis]|jgi:CRISPR-associated protein, dpsyc system, GSU0053 family|uniref:type I-G CRISPR-associated RAMP protein Csb1/Cas7g n=1 Tax=Actinomyces massiliensis TaxID=461393 RepID=UPI0028E7E1F5|nr:type I-U CRISPR-associated RAMP protein Csb1/Cas7u [Actinomyces massiliensis]
MTTASEFHSQLVDLASDPAVAGLSLTGGYESLTGSTVTPPAGTIRQDGRVVGIFITADGAQAATIDSWGSVSSRCEALLAGRFGDGTLADYLNFPLVTFVDESDQVITTSVELSHRQADTTWRLARDELRKAGVDFDGIQQATREKPDSLLIGFPTAIPFGWWHSQTKRSQKAADKANKKSSSNGKSNEIEKGRDEYLGYYVMNPADSRSARLFTAEFIATGVEERRRMAGKVDALFAAVDAETKIGGNKLSTVGLGSLPPTDLTGKKKDRPTPSDLTYRTIESHAFFSVSGLRAFKFNQPEPARSLTMALTLLLYLLHHQNLSLRAGAELRLLEPGLEVRVERHGAAPEPLELPDVNEIAALVRELGAEAGWKKPEIVPIMDDSALGKIIAAVDGSTES